MLIPTYWAEARVQGRRAGRLVAFRRYSWSLAPLRAAARTRASEWQLSDDGDDLVCRIKAFEAWRAFEGLDQIIEFLRQP